MKLSREAQSALLAAQGRAGAKVSGNSPTLAELEKANLISRHDNLTNKGAWERSALAQAKEDEAFGG